MYAGLLINLPALWFYLWILLLSCRQCCIIRATPRAQPLRALVCENSGPLKLKIFRRYFSSNYSNFSLVVASWQLQKNIFFYKTTEIPINMKREKVKINVKDHVQDNVVDLSLLGERDQNRQRVPDLFCLFWFFYQRLRRYLCVILLPLDGWPSWIYRATT